MTRAVRALVGAQVVSSLGSLMTAVALPWFVLETTGSATRVSVVLAAEAAPLLLLGVPSARLVARHGPWRALVACDAVWVVTTAAIALLALLGALSFPLLATLGAPAVLWLDAASFLVSLLIVAFVVPPVGPGASEPGAAGRHAGWRFVGGDAWMRPVTAAQALSQGAFAAMTAASSVVLGAGFVGLLAAGPALEHGDPSLAWIGIAALQTVAAVHFARSALLVGSEGPVPSWPGG